MVEHWSCKPGVESSILSGGRFFLIFFSIFIFLVNKIICVKFFSFSMQVCIYIFIYVLGWKHWWNLLHRQWSLVRYLLPYFETFQSYLWRLEPFGFLVHVRYDKVEAFWKGHKIWKNIPHAFDKRCFLLKFWISELSFESLFSF